MNSPLTGKPMKKHIEQRSMRFRKDTFPVNFHAYKCEDTGELFEDELFANLNYNQVINQYRTKYNIPFPDKIKKIRENYGVSAIKMSEILGFGANSYRKYEEGEVPGLSNARLIQLVEDPHELLKLSRPNNNLPENFKSKLEKNASNLIEKRKREKQNRYVEKYLLGNCSPSPLTGYKETDLSKIEKMVIFFAKNQQPFKTKLNKLLFYADFTMYKKYGYSISGTKYHAIDMGPVPNNFNSIYEYLANKNSIEIISYAFPDGNVGEQFQPKADSTSDFPEFSMEETEILETVANKFYKTSTQEIIQLSHQEKAWVENKESKQTIDYNYSFFLKE